MARSTNDESIVETIIQIPKNSSNLRSDRTSFETPNDDVARTSANQSSDSEETCATNIATVKNEAWVINVKCEDGEDPFEGEKVCRICHLNSEQPSKSVSSTMTKVDLIMLGCGCKGELSVAHLHCAEAWFKLKGNRICEICGQTASNVTGTGNGTFMEEWKERRLNRNAPHSLEMNAEEGCWHGQPLCNFLTVCLVIAFIIPWFFRINFW